MGKKHRCTNDTLQLSNGAEFHSLLGTKLSSVVTTLGRTFFLTEITVIPDFRYFGINFETHIYL